MIYSQRTRRVVDYLGTHQHLAVDLDLRVDEEGGLRIRSCAQRLYEGRLALRIPWLLLAEATVHEWFDGGRFRIEVDVRHPRFGPLFGYRGSFTAEYRSATEVPATVRPLRECAKE
jgi:hypothetical protein